MELNLLAGCGSTGDPNAIPMRFQAKALRLTAASKTDQWSTTSINKFVATAGLNHWILGGGLISLHKKARVVDDNLHDHVL